MRIYLAADFGRQAEMCEVRGMLTELGHEITSRWLDAREADTPEGWAVFAARDIEDVRDSDTVVSFTTGTPARGGRHVEYGLALAWGLHRVIVGPPEHLFHGYPGATFLADWRELLTWAAGDVVT
jgi:hypothetical protein